MKRVFGALLLMGGCFGLHAAGLSTLYTPETLESWRARYERSTNRLLDEYILPKLTDQEKRSLGRAEIKLPIYAPGDSKDNPLEFYSRGDLNQVVLPVLSLKFLDDLSLAYAWLQRRGYAIETVSEYTAILRYGKPPAGGFPAPLPALGIPANATSQGDVDELAQEHFLSARTFILLHEMGHLLYRHKSGLPSDKSILQETQADRFAIDVMKRMRLEAKGIVIYFMVDAHWSQYPANAGATHPLSGARVAALAAGVDDLALAEGLRFIGRLLDDPEIRDGFAMTGAGGDLSALAPRRPGELPRRTGPTRAANGQPFDGVFRGELFQYNWPGAMPAEFTLERRGETVTGRFTMGLGFFLIKQGTAVGNKLYFDWEFGPSYGRGEMTMYAPGRFTGTWGYREARTGAGILAANAIQSTYLTQSIGR